MAQALSLPVGDIYLHSFYSMLQVLTIKAIRNWAYKGFMYKNWVHSHMQYLSTHQHLGHDRTSGAAVRDVITIDVAG